jgi:hypothetical protein
MTTSQELRSILVKQGACSIATHHTALLIVPEEKTWAEDISYAVVYGVDNADEECEVRSLPECWDPAGQISGEEYAAIAVDETKHHTWISKKWISNNVCIDESQAVKLLDTPGKGTYGIYKAPTLYGDRVSDDWQIYLETNADPAILPHADYPEELADVLSDAGITQADLEAAIGQPWSHWCG